MQKVFFFKDISIEVNDNQEVYLNIKSDTPGNFITSYINIPGDNDFSFPNDGEMLLGKGQDLKKGVTIIYSEILNNAENIDNIALSYSLQDDTVVSYNELKSVSDRPVIIIQLNFK